MDFVDTCDRVSTLLWYEERDPFDRHDFKQAIPNLATQTKSSSDLEYVKMTIKEQGLWTALPKMAKK